MKLGQSNPHFHGAKVIGVKVGIRADNYNAVAPSLSVGTAYQMSHLQQRQDRLAHNGGLP